MARKNYKYKTSFSSAIQYVPASEKEKESSPLEELKNIIPAKFREREHIDLLPIAFNGCVVGLANKNDDLIDKSVCLASYESFIDKYLNLDHDNTNIVGHIVNAGFSEFGTNKILSKQELGDIFNLTLAAVVYVMADNNLAEILEECSDPESEYYECISASWEIGFSDYDIMVGDKDITKAQIIEAKEDREKYETYLRANGGNGKDESGKDVYRLIKGKIVPLGFGLVANPAAEVKGIIIATIDKLNKKIQDIVVKTLEEHNVSSHLQPDSVKPIIKDMKFTNIKEIEEKWSEVVKLESAASITSFIQDEITQKSEQWALEKRQQEELLAKEKEQNQNVAKELEDLKAKYAEVESSLNKIKEEQEKALAQEVFNSRMAEFDSVYNLDDDERAILAKDLNGMTEESYAQYKEKMSKLLKGKKKEEKKSQASEGEKIEKAVEKAEIKDKVDIITPPPVKESMADRWKKAFSVTVNNQDFNLKV